jgi:hypothetical protein
VGHPLSEGHKYSDLVLLVRNWILNLEALLSKYIPVATFKEVNTGGDYEECHLLGYKNPVRTSQETHYVSATKPSRLILYKI